MLVCPFVCFTPQYRVIQKEVYTFKHLFYNFYCTYGDVLYIDWRENSQSLFHILQALNVSPTCDAADIKSIIQLFRHSSQHVTGNSSHSLSDAPLQIIDIRNLRDFLSVRTQDMDLESVIFIKQIVESVYFFLNNPVYSQPTDGFLWYEGCWDLTLNLHCFS
jgi:hypothetical protein